MKTQKLILPPIEEIDAKIAMVDNPQVAALLRLLRNGLRCSESIGLVTTDCIPTNGCVVARVNGKGNKTREVPLFPDTALACWLAVENDRWPITTERRAILTSAQRPQLSRKQAYNLCVKHTGCHPHILRHIYATDLRNHGVPIEILQDLLGHESIVTTRIYYHTTTNQLIEATLSVTG